MSAVQKFNVGDKVYYAEDGPEDTGTVREVVAFRQRQRGKKETGKVLHYQYVVDFDGETDTYTEGQLVLVKPMDDIKTFITQANTNPALFK